VDVGLGLSHSETVPHDPRHFGSAVDSGLREARIFFASRTLFLSCLQSQVRHGPEWRESAHLWGAEGPWRNEASSCLWDPITPTAIRRAASSDESLWRCLFRQSSRGRSAVSIRRWSTKHESLSERCDHPSDIINANLWCTAGRRDSGNRRWYTEHQATSSTGQTRFPIHAGETVEDQASP
jgi:hypothetical protein